MSRIVVTRPSKQDLSELGVQRWPTWQCEISHFPWRYEQKETCYLVAGRVTVTAGTQTVVVHAGDLVVFPAGLECTWNVHSAVEKHYKLG